MIENKVTFTTLVKEEICSREMDDRELLCTLSGFIKVNGNLTLSSNGMSLSLQSENSKIAKWVFNALKKLFNVSPSYSFSKKMKLNKASIFGIHVQDRVMEILETLELMEDGFPNYPSKLVKEDGLRHFISGAFLASGSVNSPQSKNYHLQLVLGDDESAHYFMKLLNRFRNERAMEFKVIARRKKQVLYLKKADQIATFLSIISAHNCLMDFENVRIEKDFFNSDNRIQVCFNANYQKSLQKGEEQCREINYLIEHGSLYSLNEKEREVALVRLEHVDASLAHIAEVLNEEKGISLSKSGINHVFMKIHEKYKEIKNVSGD